MEREWILLSPKFLDVQAFAHSLDVAIVKDAKGGGQPPDNLWG